MNNHLSPEANWSHLPEDGQSRDMLFGESLGPAVTGNLTFTSEGVRVQTKTISETLLVTDIYNNAAVEYLDREFPDETAGSVLSSLEGVVRNSRSAIDQVMTSCRLVRERLQNPESAQVVTSALNAYRAATQGIEVDYNSAARVPESPALQKLALLTSVTGLLLGRKEDGRQPDTPEELLPEAKDLLKKGAPELAEGHDDTIKHLIGNFQESDDLEDVNRAACSAMLEASQYILTARVAVLFHDIDRITYSSSLHQRFQMSNVTKKVLVGLERILSPEAPYTSLMTLFDLGELLTETNAQLLRYAEESSNRITPLMPKVGEGPQALRVPRADLGWSDRKAIINNLLVNRRFTRGLQLQFKNHTDLATYFTQIEEYYAEANSTREDTEEATEPSLQPEAPDYNKDIKETIYLIQACAGNLALFSPSSKQLRKDGIVGQGSLEDKLRQMRGMNGHVEPGVKTYAGLKTMVELYGAEAGVGRFAAGRCGTAGTVW